jgi:hypothetical protein
MPTLNSTPRIFVALLAFLGRNAQALRVPAHELLLCIAELFWLVATRRNGALPGAEFTREFSKDRCHRVFPNKRLATVGNRSQPPF